MNNFRAIFQTNDAGVATATDGRPHTVCWFHATVRRVMGLPPLLSENEVGSAQEEVARGNPGSIEGAFRKLPARIAELEKLTQRLEVCFLNLGSLLEKLPDASEELVKRSERLLALASGKEAGNEVFAEVTRILEEPLAFVESGQERFVALTCRMTAAISKIDSLASAEADLTRAVAPLTYIQTIFKIESASLPHAIQQMFLALTDDIERLHHQVSQTFGEKFAALRRVQFTLNEANNRLQSYTNSQGGTLVERRRQIATAISKFNDDLQCKVARNVQLTDATRLIYQEVGKMVVCLQSQDIIGQKIAHICTALHQVVQTARSAAGAVRIDRDCDDLAFCAASCRLQVAQIEGVSIDLTEASKAIGDAVEQVQLQLRGLDERASSHGESHTLALSADDLVESLLQAIAEVRSMVGTSVANADAAFSAVQSVGGLASNLTTVVRHLSSQIKIIALNAQIQAAHNCGGTGLEVLAANTGVISATTGDVSERIASGVDAFTAELNSLVEEFGKLRREAVSWNDRIEVEFRSREQVLCEIRDATAKELKLVAETLGDIETLVQGMVDKNQLGGAAGNSFGELTKVLGICEAAASAAVANAGFIPEAKRFSDRLSAGYSVSSELEIHRRVFGIAPPPPAVEMFGDGDSLSLSSSSVAAGVVSEIGGAGSASGNQAGGAIAPAAAPATGESKSLGDNIELF